MLTVAESGIGVLMFTLVISCIGNRISTTVTLGSRDRKSGQTAKQNDAKSLPNLTNSRPETSDDGRCGAGEK